MVSELLLEQAQSFSSPLPTTVYRPRTHELLLHEAGAAASSAWTAETLSAWTADTLLASTSASDTTGTGTASSSAAAANAGLTSEAFLEWEAEALLECPRLERTLPPAFDSGVKDPDSSIGCACCRVESRERQIVASIKIGGGGRGGENKCFGAGVETHVDTN